MERPCHWSGELRYLRWLRRPPLLSHVPPDSRLGAGHDLGPLSGLRGVLHVRASAGAGAGAGAFPNVRLTHAGHIHPTASERHRPVSASISSLLGNVRNDRPGPLRRHAWQITHSGFMWRNGIVHGSRRGRRTGAGWLQHSSGRNRGPQRGRLSPHLERRAQCGDLDDLQWVIPFAATCSIWTLRCARRGAAEVERTGLLGASGHRGWDRRGRGSRRRPIGRQLWLYPSSI
jgi:hypothetical protein